MFRDKKFAFLICLLAVLSAGCRKRSIKLIPLQQLFLQDVPELSPGNMGFVEDRHGAGYYYFADPRTRKTIYFYDMQGRLADTVRLPKLMPLDDHVSHIMVKSKDTMMALSGYDNYLYTFGKGKTYSVADLGPQKHNGYRYTIARPSRPDFANDVGYSFAFAYVQGILFPDTMNAVDQLRFIYKLYHDGPSWVRITQLTTGHPRVEFVQDGFANRLKLDTAVNGMTRLMTSSDRAVFYHYAEFDTLYKFNSVTGKLEDQVSVHADSARITIDKIPYGVNYQDYHDRNSMEKGMIQYMDYDPYRKLLYMRYFYEVQSNARPTEKGDHRKWSLLVYDDQLHKVGEVPFAANSYNPMSLIVTPNGLLFEKVNLNQTDNETAKEFQLFKVDYRD